MGGGELFLASPPIVEPSGQVLDYDPDVVNLVVEGNAVAQ